MAFANDRDLVVLEPGVFREAAWAAQRLVSGTGSVSGTTLTLETGGVDFAAAQVGAGSVALVDGAAVEVVARTGASTLTVSRVRTDGDQAAIGLVDASGATIEVFSFAAQIEGVHRQVMRMVGIEPDDDWSDNPLGEADITNPGALRRVEALGALAQIYAAASAAGPVGGEMEKKSALYRARFGEERQRVAVLVDLDDDGRPDATRRLNVVRFRRG